MVLTTNQSKIEDGAVFIDNLYSVSSSHGPSSDRIEPYRVFV